MRAFSPKRMRLGTAPSEQREREGEAPSGFAGGGGDASPYNRPARNQMTPIGVDQIKELRERTGTGVMECKTALADAKGDLSRAIELLRERGFSAAQKKAGRKANEGLIGHYLHTGGKLGVLIEINCETDFVARNEEFHRLAQELAMQVAGASPAPRWISRDDVPAKTLEKERALYRRQAEGEAEERDRKKPPAVIDRIVEGKIQKFYKDFCLLEQPSIRDPKTTVENLIKEAIAKLGENIVVRRFVRLQLGEEG